MGSGFWFRRVVRKVEIFSNTGSGLVCIRCCSISHEWLEDYRNRSEKCVIYTREYQANEY